MTKAIWIVAIAVAFVVGASAGLYLSDNVAEAAAPAKQTGCAPGTVKHWDKIIFEVDVPFITVDPDNPPTLVPLQAYDIKVPDTVGVIADLHAIVAGDLTSKGYHLPGTSISPASDNINIRDVEYTTFCIVP